MRRPNFIRKPVANKDHHADKPAPVVRLWPYKLFVIMPINCQLKAIGSADASSKSGMLIEQWGTLHAIRSAFGFAATLIFLWASMG